MAVKMAVSRAALMADMWVDQLAGSMAVMTAPATAGMSAEQMADVLVVMMDECTAVKMVLVTVGKSVVESVLVLDFVLAVTAVVTVETSVLRHRKRS